jgi:hypothetical protein
MQERVRPKQPVFNYKPLEAVIRQWVLKAKWANWNSIAGLW